jgi:hypothetical protein
VNTLYCKEEWSGEQRTSPLRTKLGMGLRHFKILAKLILCTELIKQGSVKLFETGYSFVVVAIRDVLCIQVVLSLGGGWRFI